MSDSNAPENPLESAITRGARPFVDRHIGPDDGAIADMLKAVGFESLEALMDAAVPGRIRASDALELPSAATETQAAAELPSERTAEDAPATDASDELAARRQARLSG